MSNTEAQLRSKVLAQALHDAAEVGGHEIPAGRPEELEKIQRVVELANKAITAKFNGFPVVDQCEGVINSTVHHLYQLRVASDGTGFDVFYVITGHRSGERSEEREEEYTNHDVYYAASHYLDLTETLKKLEDK